VGILVPSTAEKFDLVQETLTLSGLNPIEIFAGYINSSCKAMNLGLNSKTLALKAKNSTGAE
jgi:hypothetical protein